MHKVMTLFAVTGLVLAIQGCSLYSKAPHYRVPDYYATSQIPVKHEVGQTYDLANLRPHVRVQQEQTWFARIFQGLENTE